MFKYILVISFLFVTSLMPAFTPAFAQSVPEYEVYSIMLSKFVNGGGLFRFADETDPVLFTKNHEDAPINCIYIKGADVELIYGPGGSEETLRAIGITEIEVPPIADYETMLARLGTAPENIDYVIVGHTCFDELGGVDKFPNANRDYNW